MKRYNVASRKKATCVVRSKQNKGKRLQTKSFSCQNRKSNKYSLSKKILFAQKNFLVKKGLKNGKKWEHGIFESFSKKRISEQLLEAFLRKILFFLKKTFYFWLAAGLRSAPLQPSASVRSTTPCHQPKIKSFFQKKKNFLRKASKSCSEILFFENFQRSLVFCSTNL